MCSLKWGYTRFVILAGPFAFKFARIRFLHALCVVIGLKLGFKRYKKCFHGTRSIFWVGGAISFTGITSNRREYFYYQNHKNDPRIMETLGMFFFGLVNVQRRGEEVPEGTQIFIPGSDLDATRNYCLHPDDGRVVVIDYGNKDTMRILDETFVS